MNVCPHGAIVMREDLEGFEYPFIQENKCQECGLCKRICPVLSHDRLPYFRNIPDVFAAWNRDPEIRLQSSSGGAFSAFASYFLNQGGIVFGAAFDKDFFLYHKSIDSESHLDELRRSKYLQSRIGYSFKKIKKIIEQGKKVLFVGTPCQTAGLHSYFGKDHENLVSCALVCLGVPSQKVFQKYLDYLQKNYFDSIFSYSFRDKRSGWACNEAIRMANGQEIVREEKNQILPSFYHAFSQKVLLSRPCCYSCPFKGLPGYADIILGDFWSIRWQEPDWDDGKGTSMVLVNSDRGEKLLNDSEQYLLKKPCPFRYVQFNGNLMRPARLPKDRARFFADLDQVPFDELMDQYMRPPRGFRAFLKNAEKALKIGLKKALGRL